VIDFVAAMGRVNGFGVFDRSSLSVLLSSVSTALIFGVDAVLTLRLLC